MEISFWRYAFLAFIRAYFVESNIDFVALMPGL